MCQGAQTAYTDFTEEKTQIGHKCMFLRKIGKNFQKC